MSDVIEDFFLRQKELYDFLVTKNEISYSQDVENAARKNLALAASSYFEKIICDIVCDFVDLRTHGTASVVAFVRNKALKRQFHTLFEWEKGRNANSFFSFFGEDFKSVAESEVKASVDLSESIRAFLELGDLRNKIVHQNYAEFVSDKSSEEVLVTYKKALKFVDYLRGKFS